MSVSEEVPPPAASGEPAKLDLAPPDLAAAKRAAFEEVFPGVLVDELRDGARLGELLDTPVTAPAEARDRYGLVRTAKDDALQSLPSVSDYLAPVPT